MTGTDRPTGPATGPATGNGDDRGGPGRPRTIKDLLAAGPTLSVELFPPKTDEGMATLLRTVEDFEPLELSYVSVTYGAAGNQETRGRTRDLVVDLNRDRRYPAMAHLTCIGHSRAELDALLEDYRAHGVHDLLALAGDPPADGSPAGGDFVHAEELVELIRGHGDDFSIGVAAHPELHPRSTDRAEDRRHLARKIELADFAVTQFFFDVDDYRRLVDELADLGTTKPIVPGVMPLSNPQGVHRMAKMAGATFPQDLADAVESAAGPEDRQRVVVDAAVDLARDLIDAGAPGLHLYCMNRSETVLEIVDQLGLRD